MRMWYCEITYCDTRYPSNELTDENNIRYDEISTRQCKIIGKYNGMYTRLSEIHKWYNETYTRRNTIFNKTAIGHNATDTTHNTYLLLQSILSSCSARDPNEMESNLKRYGQFWNWGFKTILGLLYSNVRWTRIGYKYRTKLRLYE